MKKLILPILALAFAGTSCDKISEDEYLQEVVIDTVDNGQQDKPAEIVRRLTTF
ncbi:MAG: hypothetical protein V4616_14380 [Bacteroidota bacterium]